MRVAMLALLCVVPFGLSTGRLTNSPKPETAAATSFPGLTDGTIRSAVLGWCDGGDNQTEIENTYGPISGWDTSQVTDMSGLFQHPPMPLFTSHPLMFCNPDISNWNTANVINMKSMFVGCMKFNSAIGKWNTAKVINMNRMFEGTFDFNQPLGDWNTAEVRDMAGMFKNALKFNQALGKWNTEAVTQYSDMFLQAGTFNKALCWTNKWGAVQMGFDKTACPIINLDNPINPPRTCWGIGTPNDCSPIPPFYLNPPTSRATKQPTSPPTKQPTSCRSKGAYCSSSSVCCSKKCSSGKCGTHGGRGL